ncbi:unnamed protein product [Pieris macdunnoughi]|uniref:Uncharacterized protein n=1 Tax=Pieris macdunnoughi TaxID=345717 RepID=A0A821QRM3_9NEOP|nr:unnamed protein product [Pieris macdunnoughi]
MKDKRLEVKLSVRGDGSLSRNSTRSSVRSNRSNLSNSSELPVSEIFATDRFAAPHHRAFDILDKYRRQPNQNGYPAQSLQALDQFDRPRHAPDRNSAYVQYTSLRDRGNITLSRTALNPPYNQIYGTLPRHGHYTQDNASVPGHFSTLPSRVPRRVRISELQPIVYGYGTLTFSIKLIYETEKHW